MGAYNNTVIADGASHYWRLGEASGTTAVDQVAAGNAPGTISGGVTLGVPGALSDGDTAMAFDSTQTGRILTGSCVQPVPLAIECWFRTTFPSESMVFSLTDASVIYLGNAGSGIVLRFGGVGGVDGTRIINDGLWHHIVVLLSATIATLYLDGVIEAQGANARSTGGTGACQIGAHANPHWMNGDLDEVAIYPLLLTPAQIANHYALRLATGGGGAHRPISWGAYTSTFGQGALA